VREAVRTDKRGHYAAACIALLENQGKVVELSWTIAADIDRRELIGREVDLIAAHGTCLRSSPACQFHGPSVS
jgi:hypothetical protein